MGQAKLERPMRSLVGMLSRQVNVRMIIYQMRSDEN